MTPIPVVEIATEPHAMYDSYITPDAKATHVVLSLSDEEASLNQRDAALARAEKLRAELIRIASLTEEQPDYARALASALRISRQALIADGWTPPWGDA